jgi:electron transport complex protein RnfD
METKLIVSTSPHVRADQDVRSIMFQVVVALIPAFVGAIFFFGVRALLLTVISVLTAVASEAAVQRLRKKPITIGDGSAVVTGILLAFNLPGKTPLWLPVIGSFFAIVIVKQLFGGLGYNVINPALAGRALLMASWPVHMTADWAPPSRGVLSGISQRLGIDAVTTATPLNLFKMSKAVLSDPNALPAQVEEARIALAALQSKGTLINLFWGNVGGCIGETSAVLLLLGGIWLFYKRIIDWRIPVAYIGTVLVLSWVAGGTEGLFSGNVLFHVFSGGLLLGAIFMATDMVTSPVTPNGRLIFGVGCGLVTMIIRLIGGYPEGVSYSILLMNAATPLLDRWTRPKKLGERTPMKASG